MKQRPVSFIEAAIPLERGVARHFEHNDETAKVTFNRAGDVAEIHTPQDSIRRLHEVLHANYSNPDDYKGFRPIVKDITEDVRLHTRHWPWEQGKTPASFIEDADALFTLEDKAIKAAESTFGGGVDPFKDFMRTLRRHSVYNALGVSRPKLIKYLSVGHHRLAEQILGLMRTGQAVKAAQLIERAFFAEEERIEPKKSPPPPESEGTDEGEGDEESDEKIIGDEAPEELWESRYIAKMETIHLPLTEPTDHNSKGYRLANSGSRIYRPALRRPQLPQRLFIRSSPVAPGGAILFDASGSMGVDMSVLLSCTIRAPAAIIGIYCGDDERRGWLYIVAKDGMRVRTLERTKIGEEGGNSVDGPAMDWLLAQDGPRIFVTDRQFCGSADSLLQGVRLTNYEAMGEIEVIEHYTLFNDRFPPVVGEAT